MHIMDRLMRFVDWMLGELLPVAVLCVIIAVAVWSLGRGGLR